MATGSSSQPPRRQQDRQQQDRQVGGARVRSKRIPHQRSDAEELQDLVDCWVHLSTCNGVREGDGRQQFTRNWVFLDNEIKKVIQAPCKKATSVIISRMILRCDHVLTQSKL
jgi:hypothetical protein